ncbi:MAG: class I mannose-6-phosphate isomerase [Deltaproteobacteria bacterium]|nr:class I mannose-6-phosphate isomerase [Deltaproteobacteria bacterium]
MAKSGLTDRPVALAPDNFTPRLRTPWGGTYISRHLKENLNPDAVGLVIGESWEFSCEPSFPSKLVGEDQTLAEFVASAPDDILSPSLAAKSAVPSCEILVKIIDAQDKLSLQVHPHDHDSFLKANECGKPESWYVLAAAKGAGVYLGFREAMTKEKLNDLLLSGENLEAHLQFVPLKPGDYLEIPPGICHAVGKGITLVEPQRIVPGKMGRTYRMWDWGRTYNEQGQLDPHGKPRDLHIKESLALVDPTQDWGPALIEQLYCKPVRSQGAGYDVLSFGTNPYYRSHLVSLEENAMLTVEVKDAYAAMLSLAGEFSLTTPTQNETRWQKGQPALLPHKAFPLSVRGIKASQLFLVTPGSGTCLFSQGGQHR